MNRLRSLPDEAKSGMLCSGGIYEEHWKSPSGNWTVTLSHAPLFPSLPPNQDDVLVFVDKSKEKEMLEFDEKLQFARYSIITKTSVELAHEIMLNNGFFIDDKAQKTTMCSTYVDHTISAKVSDDAFLRVVSLGLDGEMPSYELAISLFLRLQEFLQVNLIYFVGLICLSVNIHKCTNTECT
jgi:hypothetical protein